MNKSLLEYHIYTDGSAKGNGRTGCSGGWAFAVVYEGTKIAEDCGSTINTTNNRMELTAVLKALQYCDRIWNRTKTFNIYTDSAYIYNCYNMAWYKDWMENGWVNSKKQPVANVDLWVQIIPYFNRFSFVFHKVKAHSVDYYNNYVDNLSQQMAERMYRS